MRSWINALTGRDARTRFGLFVDGPNLLRADVELDLDDLRKAIDTRGRVTIRRVYLDHRAPARLVQAVEAAGYEVITTSGDVDVRLAVDATAAIEAGDLEGVAIASRDLDFKPVLERARRRNLETVVVLSGNAERSAGLLAAADEVVTLDG